MQIAQIRVLESFAKSGIDTDVSDRLSGEWQTNLNDCFVVFLRFRGHLEMG